MKRISIKKAILLAVDDTDSTIVRHMNQLMKWAKYIELQIGTPRSYPYKTKVVEVTGASIDLPSDCYKVKAVFAGDCSDILNLRYIDSRTYFLNVDVTGDDFDTEYIWGDLSGALLKTFLWEETAGLLNFADELNAETITLLYQYIETDVHGDWLINESHERAIADYLIFKIVRKYLFKSFRSDKMTRNNDVQLSELYRRDYNISVRGARALDNQSSPIDSLDNANS